MIKFHYLFILLLLTTVAGCANLNAVQFQPDFNLVNDLKDMNIGGIAVDDFASQDDKITIRGASMASPFDGSYGAYLKNALKEQLAQAGLLDESSNIRISGDLLINDIDAGAGQGKTVVSARFVVIRDKAEVYNKVHTVNHLWDSFFSANVALPNAQASYPVAIQKILKSLFSDNELKDELRSNVQ